MGTNKILTAIYTDRRSKCQSRKQKSERLREIAVNDSGDKLIVCKQHGLKMCNIFFEYNNIHIYMEKIFAKIYY